MKQLTLNARQMNSLLKTIKNLVLQDVNGITSTDVRNEMAGWLEDCGDVDGAKWLQDQVYKYQISDEIKKLEEL